MFQAISPTKTCPSASIHRSPGRVRFVQIVSSSPLGLKIWTRSFSRSHTKTRPSVCTQTLCGRLNWPGSAPGSPHDWISSPIGGEAVDARVAVAIRDVQVAVGRHRQARRPVERARRRA